MRSNKESKEKVNKEEAETKRTTGLAEEDFYDLDLINARIESRKKIQRERRARSIKRRRIVLIATVLILGGFFFSISSFFTVDNIEVRGNKYFSAEEIINMAHAAPGKNLIYKPQKGMITDYLEDNPYIKSAKVSRHFPSTLVITVKERAQVGALKFDDEFLIIDNDGILLRKTKTTPKLTEIKGIVVKKIELGEKVAVEDEDLLNQTLNILNSMNKNDVYFVSLDMSEMYIKAYIYNNFVCKGTYDQLLDGIESNRLHRVLDKLMSEGIRRGTITFSDDGYVSFVPTL